VHSELLAVSEVIGARLRQLRVAHDVAVVGGTVVPNKEIRLRTTSGSKHERDCSIEFETYFPLQSLSPGARQ
jgi:hypothetical protein